MTHQTQYGKAIINQLKINKYNFFLNASCNSGQTNKSTGTFPGTIKNEIHFFNDQQC